MFGMELYELFNFTRQAGLALAGATSLWALVFLWRARKSEGEKKKALEWAANRLLLAFSVAFGAAAFSWFVLWNIWPVLAHEGITLFPSGTEYRSAFLLTAPLYVGWILFTLGVLVCRKFRKEVFARFLLWFYGAQFLVVSVLISLYAWTGSALGGEQLFYYFHGFHSIFTLGTVLTLDFLFLSTRTALSLQRHLFPFFPAISKIIFIGFGLDFLSVFLVFDTAVEFSARFFMAQTVVGILIINGAFMAGPLTRKVLNGLAEGRLLAGTWRYIAGVAGAVSITSWMTITFIDFFPRTAFSYTQLMGAYASVILFGIVANFFIARLDERHLASMAKP
ncbi:MAG TPA: hypothetical protein VFE94_00305 [Candidatus Paceibacterota bacterium]|nr:hypothetical protein [Candidatus Paceibacterota bacterium]